MSSRAHWNTTTAWVIRESSRPGKFNACAPAPVFATANTGASATDGVHLLQIWILPDKQGLQPGYRQIKPDPQGRSGRFQLIASDDGRDGSVDIHQDAAIYAARLNPGESVTYPVNANRRVYLQVASGRLSMNHYLLEEGDGAAVSGPESLHFSTEHQAEILLFDLP